MKKISLLKLTRKEILNDIEVFKERIRAAEKKIAALPQKANGYKERKKLKLKRRVLEQEIEHVKGLIAIASEALNDGSLVEKNLSVPKMGRIDRRKKRFVIAPPGIPSLGNGIGKREID